MRRLLLLDKGANLVETFKKTFLNQFIQDTMNCATVSIYLI